MELYLKSMNLRRLKNCSVEALKKSELSATHYNLKQGRETQLLLGDKKLPEHLTRHYILNRTSQKSINSQYERRYMRYQEERQELSRHENDDLSLAVNFAANTNGPLTKSERLQAIIARRERKPSKKVDAATKAHKQQGGVQAEQMIAKELVEMTDA
jgi:hypothetical protein